jgi:hypothetical protein
VPALTACVLGSWIGAGSRIVLANLMRAFRFEHVKTHEIRPVHRVTLRTMWVFAR